MILHRSLVAARRRSHLSLREAARRAGTSHATLLAYESARVAPSIDTFERIVAAVGQVPEVTLVRRAGGPERAAELVDVLALAEAFPARHDATCGFPLLADAPGRRRGARV